MVLPTEWAKLDVACISFYSAVYPHLTGATSADDIVSSDVNIEHSLAVSDREAAFQRKGALRARFHGTYATWHVSTGDLISFPCSSSPRLRDEDIHGWHEWQATSETGRTRFFVQGVAGPSFGVGFSKTDQFVCAGADDQSIPHSYLSVERIIRQELETPNRKIDSDPTKQTATQQKFPSRDTLTDLDLFPGDVISILRPTDPEITEGVCAVFHASLSLR